MIQKFVELLDEASRCRTNLEIADFLMLNGAAIPPVKVGARVKDRWGDEYIVTGFSHKVSRSGTKTTIDVMDVEYEGHTIFCVSPYTVEEFRRKFVEVEVKDE